MLNRTAIGAALALSTALAAASFAEPLAAQAPAAEVEQTEPSKYKLSAEAATRIADAALAEAPVWDGHNDLPIQLRGRYGNVLASFDFNDTTNVPASAPGGSTRMHTDLPRLRQGKVGAQFWSVYVSASLPEPEAVVAQLEQIDVAKRLIARTPEFAFATSADEVQRAMDEGKIASLLGMEGGSAIDGSLAVLRQMYDLGARYMTLTHSETLAWVDSATDDPKHDGLTEFGEKVVREMQRIGMLVDLSHTSEATMRDTLDLVERQGGAPVMFSHSGARAVNGHSRNVPDDVLARLKRNGGIVMVVGLPAYLSENLREYGAARTGIEAAQKALWLGRPDKVSEAMAQWDADNPPPKATISDLADHIDHIREIAGIDHIGLGGDYDGMDTGPVGMEDVAGYPALFVELARRGYSQADLEKIASRNMMRVLRAAEAYKASAAALAPIETPVAE